MKGLSCSRTWFSGNGLALTLSAAPAALMTVGVVGAATALFAATIGVAQNDIKKVLAYSTVSQLGYMFLACGVGAFGVAIFHLATHAFFKALLFLGAGSVQVGNGDLLLGADTYKLPFGHHGGNHPVRRLSDGDVAITAQNHGFAVDLWSLTNTSRPQRRDGIPGSEDHDTTRGQRILDRFSRRSIAGMRCRCRRR